MVEGGAEESSTPTPVQIIEFLDQFATAVTSFPSPRVQPARSGVSPAYVCVRTLYRRGAGKTAWSTQLCRQVCVRSLSLPLSSTASTPINHRNPNNDENTVAPIDYVAHNVH